MKSTIGKDMANGFADLSLNEAMGTAEMYSGLLFECARLSPAQGDTPLSKDMRDDADTFRQLAAYIRLTIN